MILLLRDKMVSSIKQLKVSNTQRKTLRSKRVIMTKMASTFYKMALFMMLMGTISTKKVMINMVDITMALTTYQDQVMKKFTTRNTSQFKEL